MCRCNILIVIFRFANYCRCNVLIELLLLEHYRLCRCSVVIVILRLANYRLRRCNVLIDLLLLENYRLCRCSVVIEKLPANFRSCKCDALSLVCYHYIAFQHFFLVWVSCPTSSENTAGLLLFSKTSLSSMQRKRRAAYYSSFL